eukprot:1487264-Pyramimonas_sp.AAC.1
MAGGAAQGLPGDDDSPHPDPPHRAGGARHPRLVRRGARPHEDGQLPEAGGAEESLPRGGVRACSAKEGEAGLCTFVCCVAETAVACAVLVYPEA